MQRVSKKRREGADGINDERKGKMEADGLVGGKAGKGAESEVKFLEKTKLCHVERGGISCSCQLRDGGSEARLKC